MADLITEARAREKPPVTSLGSTEIGNLISAATAAIEKFCNRIFASTAHVEDYQLPEKRLSRWELIVRNFPIISLTNVIITDPDGTTETVVSTDFHINKEDGIITFKDDNASSFTIFPVNNFQSVQVSYTAGFVPVPEDVQEACAQMVVNMKAAGEDKNNQSFKSEKIGDYAYTRTDQDKADLFTKKIRQLLTGYVDHRI